MGFRSSFAYAILIILFSCSRANTVRLTGSSTLMPPIADIAKLYEKKYSVQVRVESGGSGRGLRDARKGVGIIGMVSRDLSSKEKNDLQYEVVAKDALAIIVHQDNPVENFSLDTLKKIYTGQINKWSKFKIPLGKIIRVHKAEGRATLEVFLQALKLENKEIKPDLIAGENQEVIKTVSSHKNAIGYVSFGAATEEIKQGAAIRIVKVNGTQPSEKTILNEKYPIRRSLVLVWKDPLSTNAKQFLKFVFSKEAGKIFQRHGFIPTLLK
ncbi:MAG: phosphate ABC transporter substrate-binding protein [Candidatus Hydrogenedentota bacterium]|nr:MAG: phosphate ABC transporter substrate-binding protein [Candidatus Hydrogenedentota bacterium]